MHIKKEHNSDKPINFMDDLKLSGSNKNQLDSLLHTMRIFSEDICMKFGLDKCAVLKMKRGNKLNSTGIELSDQS